MRCLLLLPLLAVCAVARPAADPSRGVGFWEKSAEDESHRATLAYINEWSTFDKWGLPPYWTVDEEMKILADIKKQDCRVRIEETGDHSWNKLYLYGNTRFGNRPSLIKTFSDELAATPETDVLRRDVLNLRIGREMLASGNFDGALDRFLLLCDESVPEATSCMSDGATSRYSGVLRDLVALAYFRMAETQNCLNGHTFDSCLFPIKGGGVHRLPRGASAAVKALNQTLKINPNDLGNRWLYNLAHMLLGTYPDSVQPSQLIPPSVFASEYDIGRFYDISGAIGVTPQGLAGGAIMEDFDRDGYLDIMSSGSSPRDILRYYHNNRDGTFTDMTQKANLGGQYNAINMGHTDYNNDGYPDVMMIRGGWHFDWYKLPNSLLRNNRDGTFTDVTELAGLGQTKYCGSHSSDWGDYDNDGWLDVFVACEVNFTPPPPFEPQPCMLFHNNRDGTFTDVAPGLGLDKCGWTKGIAFGDYNNDGRMDIYMSHYEGVNQLLRNDGPSVDGSKPWTFTDVTEAAGVPGPKFGFAAWFFDYNNDGWEDIFNNGFSTVDIWKVAQLYLDPKLPISGDRNVLYRNNGDGTFTDVSVEVGVHRSLNTMGANYGDLDNDGWLDFMSGTGAPDLRTLQPNRMWRNDKGKYFQDVTTAGGFGNLQKGHGVAFGDLDNDGDQDVQIQIGAMYSADWFTDAVYLNPGHGNHYITIRPVGVQTNKLGSGAKITTVVETPSYPGGKRTIYNRVTSGGTYGSGSYQAEIGLGDATRIESITVFWPVSGTRTTFTNVPIDSIIQITEGQSEFVVLTYPPIDLKTVGKRMVDDWASGIIKPHCSAH